MNDNLLLFDVPSESPANISETKINNPFDECEWIANHNTEELEDPFDIVAQKINKFDRSTTNNLLINMNGSCESNNNQNLSNNSLDISVELHSGNNSILLTPGSVKMAHKLVKLGGSPSPSTLKQRSRINSDSGILKMTQGKHLLEKLRETTSLSDEAMATVSKKTHEILCPSFTQGDTSCEDLNSTTPKWIDLEQEDVSDIETLTIPFLKENENKTRSTSLEELGLQHRLGSSGEQHTKSEMNMILTNIKKSNENEEKQLFLRNLETSVVDFMEKYEISKNCDKIKIMLKMLIELLEGKDYVEEDANKSNKIIRQETFDLPKKNVEPVKSTLQLPSLTKKPSRTSLNVSARESISHRPAVTTPKAKVRSSISHPLSTSKKENRSPTINVARRSLYATPSKLIKPVVAEVPSARLRLRTKTQTLSTGGPIKALEPTRTALVIPKVTYTGTDHNISSVSTPIPSRRSTTSNLSTPSKTPIGKVISKMATPSRISRLSTPSRVRTTLSDLNAP